ncbi:MAG: carboxylating nicotinate-nucleotide diphosphorylase [Gammaproteobacteria bacterium]
MDLPKMLPDILPLIRLALAEDIGTGDINAQLVPENRIAQATIVTREEGVLCGQPWVNAIFAELAPAVQVTWHVEEGVGIHANELLCTLDGPARALLTGERTALNFLQTLCGTATITRQYVEKLAGTKAQLLDTRKTIPGLRVAQKYAVKIGGGKNHRMGLYDAFLIKENHIAACGSITLAVGRAREIAADKLLEVEVENLTELAEALQARVDVVLCDNFSLELLQQAVHLTAGQAKLEASGNITLINIAEVAATGVDYISLGALTKHVHALDLSMRLVM